MTNERGETTFVPGMHYAKEADEVDTQLIKSTYT